MNKKDYKRCKYITMAVLILGVIYSVYAATTTNDKTWAIIGYSFMTTAFVVDMINAAVDYIIDEIHKKDKD